MVGAGLEVECFIVAGGHLDGPSTKECVGESIDNTRDKSRSSSKQENTPEGNEEVVDS